MNQFSILEIVNILILLKEVSWSEKKSQSNKSVRVNTITMFQTPPKSEEVSVMIMDLIKIT